MPRADLDIHFAKIDALIAVIKMTVFNLIQVGSVCSADFGGAVDNSYGGDQRALRKRSYIRIRKPTRMLCLAGLRKETPKNLRSALI